MPSSWQDPLDRSGGVMTRRRSSPEFSPAVFRCSDDIDSPSEAVPHPAKSTLVKKVFHVDALSTTRWLAFRKNAGKL